MLQHSNLVTYVLMRHISTIPKGVVSYVTNNYSYCEYLYSIHCILVEVELVYC